MIKAPATLARLYTGGQLAAVTRRASVSRGRTASCIMPWTARARPPHGLPPSVLEPTATRARPARSPRDQRPCEGDADHDRHHPISQGEDQGAGPRAPADREAVRQG